jgi:hypothetical protein
MSEDRAVVTMMVFAIVVVCGMVYGIELSLDHAAACKQAAISKNMNYLEIKELCK